MSVDPEVEEVEENRYNLITALPHYTEMRSIEWEIIMRWMAAAAIVIASGLALSPANAADLKNAPPMVLNDQQLDQVSAAGTVFVGVLEGSDVLFSQTFFNVPVARERNRQIEVGGFTIRLISTEGDFLIPPLPFPQ